MSSSPEKKRLYFPRISSPKRPRKPAPTPRLNGARNLTLESLEERWLLSVSADTSAAYSTGLLDTTAEDLAWEADNLTLVQDVDLNDLGLKRLAAEQQAGSSVLASIEGEYGDSLVSSSGLPSSVDNSTLQYFPGIRNQGSLGSCAAFSVTYYTMTYMTALARGWDVSDTGDNTNKFSPKWVYNMVNGGSDVGATVTDVFQVLSDHGAATWAEVPYDTDYREWVYDDPSIWRNAASVRTSSIGYLYASDDAGIEDVKTMLANGYILNYTTYIFSWQYKTISDDPSTTADDSEVGKQAAYWVNGFEGGHAMTVVGYNDDIWIDINGNGEVEAAEKGAFRIANSWGTSWKDGGFTWLSYDALKQESDAGGPSENRQPAWRSSKAYWLTAYESYTPTLLAEFTIQHAERDQLTISVGKADSGTAPTVTWTPAGLSGDGGEYGFDGLSYSTSESAPTGTFVIDLTDLAPEFGTSTVYFLGLNDTTDSALAGTISSFTLTDWEGNPLASAENVPQTDTDGTSTVAYAYVESSLTDFVVDVTWLTVEEGSEATVNVKLVSAPASNVTVSAAWLSGDSDLSVTSGSTLVFTPENWDVYQSITVSAGQDEDNTNGQGVLELSAIGWQPIPIRVSEADDDVIYSAMMNSDPGWTVEGQWEWGEPQGGGGAYGNPDPWTGATGSTVMGYNLAGDYAANTSPAAWLTTTAIDCSGYGDIELRFSRWLNVESPSYDHAYLEVSKDGSTWTQIWTNTTEVTDDAWTTQTYDISSVADDQSTVYIRWGLESDTSWQYSGWNIDDVVIVGTALGDGSENQAPVADNATLFVSETAANTTVIGTVTASDADSPAQTLTYAITAGNADGVFAINSSTGQITVTDNSSLDYETTSQYSLTVRVTDNGSPNLSDTATVTINVTGVNEAPVLGNATFSLAEGTANGSNVGTVSGTDEDSPAQTLTYAITAGNADGVFAINSSTGQITVADNSSLDYETTSQYSLTVRVTDNGSPNLSDTATVTINVTGVNEAPVLGNATFSLAEGTANGSNVGTVSGTDEDSPAQTLTYAITAGNADGVFAINSSTGQITVANNSSLDYETTSQYSLTVRVTDNGSPNLSDTATVTINVTGVNEAPVLGNATFSLAEDTANGSNVGTVSGTDEDSPAQTLTYAITAGNGDGVFAINSSTGQITVADNSSLDYETTSQYSLTVRVTDNGSPNLSDTATVTINVTDVNEAPVLGNATFSLGEGTANGSNVGTVSGTDEDSPAQTLTYAITAGNADGVFAINSSTGQITVADNSSLDYETTSQYSLTVRVTDNGSPNLSDTATVTINVTGVNEAPVLGNATFSLAEGTANGSNVGTVSGTDEDSPAQTLTYAITAGNADGVFAINSSTGQITVADNSSLDYETTSQYSLTVRVTDNGSPNLSDTATVTINVTDVNEAPVLGYATFSLGEGTANGSNVGTVSGTDEDSPAQTLTYAITAGNGDGVFAINSSTGQITVADNSSLDYETTSQYSLTVRVTDNGSPNLSDTATVTINVTDVNEAPVLGNATFSVNEDAETGELVGVIAATDIDTPSQTLTYAITAGNGDGVFAIDGVTGQITVANSGMLDYITTSQYTLTVEVTDGGSPNLSSTATITVDIEPSTSIAVLGDLGSGIAVQDKATGTGFMMYSEEDVFSRFSNHSPLNGNARHVIAVKYVDGQWYFDNNGGLYAFTPVASDVLLAEVDFSADTVTSLEGVVDTYYGIVKGYVSGDVVFTANEWKGSSNAGEFGVSGTYFVRTSQVFAGDLGGGVAATDNATGSGFLMYSEEDLASRFAKHPPLTGNAAHVITVKCVDGKWYYDNNGALYAFTPVASDVLLAEIDFSADTVTSLAGVDETYSGIAKGYVGGDLSYAANQWNGVYNTGEFGISGTWFIPNDQQVVGELGGGIAAMDNATGSGFLMYSEEDLATRFSEHQPLANNATHVIAVKYLDNQWYYDNNGALYAFTPLASDVLLAEVDFSADTATSLEGVDETYEGIVKGYVGGDLSFTANQWNGVYNTGEFGISGSWFIPNDVQLVGNLGGGVAATDNASGVGFLLYSEEDLATRFSEHPPLADNASHLITVKYLDGQWYYDSNGGLYAFTAEASDVLLAEVDFGEDTIMSLAGVDDLYYGIAKGYMGGDLSFAANSWNGVYNTGEFEVSGSFFVRNS